jgi:xanthine dehydrogenase YagR molybdenum-binding subunit
MANPAAPQPKENMGAPAPRYDARLKVTGQARYPADTALANPAYAVLVTSAVAKGTLTSLALDDARAVPGVLDIFTAEDMSDLKTVEFGARCSTSIQDLGPEIRHAGQIIAVVVADTFEAATEGAQRVKATYSEATPSATFDAPGLNVADATTESKTHRHAPQAGDAASAIAGADAVLEGEYATPTQHHNPIELFTTTCAWTGDQLTVYEPSQFVYGLKNSVAERLAIDPQKVRTVSHFVGGAFGSKGVITPRTAMIALAAKRLNRPVKARPDARARIYHRDLSRRNPTPHPARRPARRQARRLLPRRLGNQLASRSLCRRRRRGHGATLCVRRRHDQSQRRTCRPQHPRLHAFATGRALRLRAGKRHGRDGGQTGNGSDRIPPHQ